MDKSDEGVNKTFHHEISLAFEQEAERRYRLALERMLDVNTWHLCAGKGTAVFQRMDSDGIALSGDVQHGDYIRIDIPGPGHSKGFDWVQVEKIEKNLTHAMIRVRPCADPTVKEADTAHFLSDDATSTFIVEKNALKVSATILGRNEQTNSEGDSVLQKARDFLMSLGAMAGASDIQWNKLAEGFLTSPRDHAAS